VPDLNELCDDLAAEHAALDLLLEPLDAAAWATPTPADGWTIRDQIAHLYFGDNRALLTAVDPGAFIALREVEYVDKSKFAHAMVGPELGPDGPSVYAAWKRERSAFIDEYRTRDPKIRVEWYGPPMSPLSKVTARIMETWAHGQDVADALSVAVPPSPRLKSIAHLGVRTRDFAFSVHGLTPPAEPFRVELKAPDDGLWVWGPEDAAQRVVGTALDFCYLVTQRRPRATLDVEAHGAEAQTWLGIAQAFAGPAGPGR
jgi:uncharacterized protein (TIGR03084 family)